MPISLIDMAKTPKEKQKEASYEPRVEEMPDYPWGLTFHLSNAELQKLNMGGGKLEAGDIVNLMAEAMVTSADAEMIAGGKQYRATLRMQRMFLAKPQTNESAADKIYGEPNADNNS